MHCELTTIRIEHYVIGQGSTANEECFVSKQATMTFGFGPLIELETKGVDMRNHHLVDFVRDLL